MAPDENYFRALGFPPKALSPGCATCARLVAQRGKAQQTGDTGLATSIGVMLTKHENASHAK